MSLCSTLRERSYWTWSQLELARQVRLSLGEESITDFHLLEIATRHPDEVKTQKFTRWQEGQNGADWEWWFVDKDMRCLGLAVQAKVLNLQSNRFDVLHYKSGKQTTKLIKWAKRAPVPLYPVYCLYSHIPAWEASLPAVDKDLLTSEFRPSFRDLAPMHGCSLLPASLILSLGSATDADQVMKDAVPWHRPICHMNGKDASLTQRVETFLTGSYQGVEVPVSSQLPSYVAAMIAGEPIDQPRPGLSAILVVHE